MTQLQCMHLNLKVLYFSNDEGSIQVEICKRENCAKIVRTICEHVKNVWVYTRNEENPEEKKLICQLCGADGT